MDALRNRFGPAAGGRLLPLLATGVLAAVLLLVAVVIAASRASGSTDERAVVPVERSTPSATPLLVHVSGAVRSPGLVALPEGSRVVDAVAAAGGATSAADQTGINLAARLADGQQVVVPKRGAAPAAAPSSGTAGSAPVSLSSATAEQLETLPRIGPALAARIVAYREAHGGFSSVDDLGQVGGIGPKTLTGLRALVVP